MEIGEFGSGIGIGIGIVHIDTGGRRRVDEDVDTPTMLRVDVAKLAEY